jgi:hypothetical protein
MARVRFHLVTAAAALISSSAGATTYVLLTGERHGLKFLGWLVMLLAFCYPSLLVAMRSETQSRCALWLKRLAAGQR